MSKYEIKELLVKIKELEAENEQLIVSRNEYIKLFDDTREKLAVLEDASEGLEWA